MAGSALPEGDVARGREVFREMRCWACHEVFGGDMPKPTASPAVPAYLGGNQLPPPDPAYLITAIINPSHELAPGWAEEQMTTTAGASRMHGYGDALTARQLFDLVSFLRSRYGPSE